MRNASNRSRTRTSHAALGISLLLGSLAIAAAQDPSTPANTQTMKMETKPTNCEFNIAVLDGAHGKVGKDDLIIVIARLGDAERRHELNRRRLHNVRTYLMEFDGRSAETIITAEGERVKGYGRVELYVGGKLFYILMIRVNADFPVGSCSYEGEDPCSHKREKKLYPCLDRNSRKR